MWLRIVLTTQIVNHSVVCLAARQCEASGREAAETSHNARPRTREPGFSRLRRRYGTDSTRTVSFFIVRFQLRRAGRR
jgi:hypothetical protein